MKCKKILALVLSCVMLLSLLAACDTDKPVDTKPQETQGSTKPTETTPPTTEDPGIVFPLAEQLEVSVMSVMGNSAYSYNDNLAWKYLQEISNIKFNMTEFASSEAAEKMGLLMSSGEYPEVLFKASSIDFDKYGADGVLLPLEDMIREYCPNLCALLDELDAWADITSPDGHIYALPNIGKSSTSDAPGMNWWINKAWLDKLGLPEPTTQEELLEVLRAFKTQDPNGNGKPDEIPMVAYSTHTSYGALLHLMGSGFNYKDYWAVVDGQMEYLPTTEWFKNNCLKFFNTLYTEGLVNEDMFTLTRDQQRAICGGEEVIYGMLWDSSCAYFADANEYQNWIALKPFDLETFGLNKGISKGGFALTDKCQNPEILMAWVDFLYTEEGGRVFRLGVEDVSYKINSDGTYETIKEGFESNVYQATLMSSATVPGKTPDLFFKPTSELTLWTNNELYGEDYGLCAQGVLVPALSLTAEENETYSIIHTDIKAYVRNYIAECTTGLVDIDATWDEFQATLKEMHVDDMVDIYRAAYDRAMGN